MGTFQWFRNWNGYLNYNHTIISNACHSGACSTSLHQLQVLSATSFVPIVPLLGSLANPSAPGSPGPRSWSLWLPLGATNISRPCSCSLSFKHLCPILQVEHRLLNTFPFFLFYPFLVPKSEYHLGSNESHTFAAQCCLATKNISAYNNTSSHLSSLHKNIVTKYCNSKYHSLAIFLHLLIYTVATTDLQCLIKSSFCATPQGDPVIFFQ